MDQELRTALGQGLLRTKALPRFSKGVHASALSGIVDGEIYGCCMRQAWLQTMGVPETNPPAPEKQLQMDLGDSVSERIAEAFNKQGRLISQEISFFNEAYGISGRLDVVIKAHDGKPCGLEVKSVGSYWSRKGTIDERRDAPLMPKPWNLVQIAVYIKTYGAAIPTWHMLYVDRHFGDFRFHSVAIDPDGMVCANGKETGLTWQSIEERLTILRKYLDDGKVPPRDFYYQYPQEVLQKKHDEGSLSKKHMAEFKKNGTVDKGDFQCRGCWYRDRCWPAHSSKEAAE